MENTIDELLGRYTTPAEEPQCLSEAEQVRRQKRLEEARAEVWKRLRAARGRRYEDNRLENYVVGCPAQQTAVDAIRSYGQNFDERFANGQNVLFIGPVGTGKDHLMFALSHFAVGKFKEVAWYNAAEIWMCFRDAMKDKHGRRNGYDRYQFSTFSPELNGTEFEMTEKLSTLQIVAISDLAPAGGNISDWQAEKLLNIIDNRYSNMLPTFVTMNVANRAEAELRMGAAVIDRLGHEALTVLCDWPSYRVKKPEGEQPE